jgi:hypothetical protein
MDEGWTKWDRIFENVNDIEDRFTEIQDLVILGMYVDGARHKQCYLAQILGLLSPVALECIKDTIVAEAWPHRTKRGWWFRVKGPVCSHISDLEKGTYKCPKCGLINEKPYWETI